MNNTYKNIYLYSILSTIVFSAKIAETNVPAWRIHLYYIPFYYGIGLAWVIVLILFVIKKIYTKRHM